jgi:modification methylase
MEEISDNSVGAIITSPPYPMIAKWDECFKKQGGFDWASQHTILLQTWIECFRVLVPGGIACINIGDATRTVDKKFMCYPNYAIMVSGMLSTGFSPLIPILWKKISNRPNAFLGSGFQPVNAYISQDCEYIGIFRKGKNRIFTGEEKERRKASKFTKEERDDWFQQVWTGIPGAKGSKKSSSWNMDIPYRLMRMFSIIGDTIVDPFCGKTGGVELEKMCNEWGREFIGYTLP